MNNVTKEQLKKLVADCNTRTALEILSSITQIEQNDLNNPVILLLARYNLNFEKIIKGVSVDETELRNINNNVLELIDKLHGNSFEYQLYTSPKKLIALQNIEKRNRQFKTGGITILILLLLLAGVFITKSQLPRDPLGIVGIWDYTVTPPPGEKLLGEDSSSLKFVPMYDKIEGYVNIKAIPPGEENYDMTGERTGSFIGSNIAPNSQKDLYFEELSYSNKSKSEYSFRFGVYILSASKKNNNQGFVRLSIFEKDGKKPNLIKGVIHYLYKNDDIANQVWREVSIEFRRRT